MSEFSIHYERSLKNVKNNYPELFNQEKEVIDKLLKDLHEWLDYFYNKKGKDEGGAYDFTGEFVIRHRSKRHHVQGINEAIVFFTDRYGKKYLRLIEEEARRHVLDDMGEVLFAEDYQRIGFWKNYEMP